MNAKRIFSFLDDVEARRRGMRVWLILVLAWSVGRSIIVAHVFHKYGLNPWIYFLIDFLSSFPYAYTSAHSLLTFIDKKRNQTLWWGAATVLLFYAPDIYIVYVSKEVPKPTYIGFGIVLILLSSAAFIHWQDLRQCKKDAI